MVQQELALEKYKRMEKERELFQKQNEVRAKKQREDEAAQRRFEAEREERARQRKMQEDRREQLKVEAQKRKKEEMKIREKIEECKKKEAALVKKRETERQELRAEEAKEAKARNYEKERIDMMEDIQRKREQAKKIKKEFNDGIEIVQKEIPREPVAEVKPVVRPQRAMQNESRVCNHKSSSEKSIPFAFVSPVENIENQNVANIEANRDQSRSRPNSHPSRREASWEHEDMSLISGLTKEDKHLFEYSCTTHENPLQKKTAYFQQINDYFQMEDDEEEFEKIKKASNEIHRRIDQINQKEKEGRHIDKVAGTNLDFITVRAGGLTRR